MSLESKLAHAIQLNNQKKIDSVFEEIYYQYGNLVAYIISKYVNKLEDIEELTNDVFINFYKRCFNTTINNIKYYLITQAKNISIDFYRKKINKLDVVYDEEYLINQPSVDSYHKYNEIISEMSLYLNEFEINVILLHQYYGYSIVSIAEKYQKPTTTISSTYHRALKKMKKGAKNEK